MRGLLLDTSILVDFLRYQRRSRPKNDQQKYKSLAAKRLIEKLIRHNINLYISCHTIKELLQYPNISKQEARRINKYLPQFLKILPTTLRVARTAGYLARHSPEFREHHIEDCYIAATALVYKLALVTRNPSDFRYVKNKKIIIIAPY